MRVENFLDTSEKILSYTYGLDQAAFIADGRTYDATLRNLELIGTTHISNIELAMSKEKQYQVYRSRIEVLRSDAELDGFAVNETSERDFWSFVNSVSFVRKAEVYLWTMAICVLSGAGRAAATSGFSSSATDW